MVIIDTILRERESHRQCDVCGGELNGKQALHNICIYTHMHIHIHTDIHIPTYIHIYIYIYTYMYIQRETDIHIPTCIYIHNYIYIYMIYIDVDIYTYTDIHTEREA